jgi:hypothetical protein
MTFENKRINYTVKQRGHRKYPTLRLVLDVISYFGIRKVDFDIPIKYDEQNFENVSLVTMCITLLNNTFLEAKLLCRSILHLRKYCENYLLILFMHEFKTFLNCI